MKFAHISDTHIKNLKNHDDYRFVFNNLYAKLKNMNVDYIIHTGDIAHTKTQISPEFVEMCSDFFIALEKIAPTYIILGNHDGNLKNSNKQDALTPIVKALNLPNLFLLKDSGEVHLGDEFCINVLSVFDRENWVQPTIPEKVNIALYHGAIIDSKTDFKFSITSGDDSVEIFKNFDFAMLGDIHACQQMDDEGRIWYAGSTVQQNHGEFNNKGFLLWDIKNKNDFSIQHHTLLNPRPFYTIYLDADGSIPKDISVPSNARLRLSSDNNLPLDVMKRSIEISKHRFKPHSLSYVNRASGERHGQVRFNDKFKVSNLRNIKTQEQLITEYLKDFEVNDETMSAVFDLNRKYNRIIEEEEDVSRNINWSINNFKWDNLFNYGEDNSINFKNLSGIVGIFGKNYSGKSSVIDAALYTIFNTTSKNERKNLNVINQNEPYGCGEIEIQIGSKIYNIKRKSEKYLKRGKGGETEEAKTELNFEVYDSLTEETTSLNGITRSQTDINIRNHLGTVEDFSMSSLASQHGAFRFLDEGSTKRKEIIAKFLDLVVFEKKFKAAKEEFSGFKALIRKNDNRNFKEEIDKLENNLNKLREDSDNNEITCEAYSSTLEVIRKEKLSIEQQLSNMPSDIFDISEGLSKKDKLTDEIQQLLIDNEKNTVSVSEKQNKLQKARDFISSIMIEDLYKSKRESESLKQITKDLKKQIRDINKKQVLLDSTPCGTQFPTCRFIKDAHISVLNRKSVEQQLQDRIDDYEKINISEVDKRISQYEKINSLIAELEKDISYAKIDIERNQNNYMSKKQELDFIQAKIEEYNKNKEVIENIQKIIQEKEKLRKEEKQVEKNINNCKKQNIYFYKEIGSVEQKIKTVIKERNEHKNLLTSYTACDLFLKCMHSNGIAYDIIKNRIPVINNEISKILTNIVNFEVFFESNGNKLEVFIKHQKHDPRPIEMGSGAEKTMAAIAIRLALLSVSSLPKPDIFILDEPGTALDEENMEGFIRILQLIKVYFKNVLLISHLDSLKDCVDKQIVIEKNNGYAKIKQ